MVELDLAIANGQRIKELRTLAHRDGHGEDV